MQHFDDGRFIADLEKSIVSVERIREYQRTPLEAPYAIPHQVMNALQVN